ncbi:MAG: hypothetical protein CAF42_011645 [Nitrospira sp. CG24B]|nr:MAG: hypothetical protein CAF42_011645 [Nitrospira sp. CG24B]
MAKRYNFITVSVVLLTSLWLSPVVSAKSPELLHVLGIVTAIDAKHIDIKTAKGPVVPVLLSKQVKFKNKSKPTSNDPPTVGDRVIIEATKDDKTKKLSATVVHYSPNKTPSPPR